MVAVTRNIVAGARSTGAVRRSTGAGARSIVAVTRSTIAVTRSTGAVTRSTVAGARSTIAVRRSTGAVAKGIGAVGNVVIVGGATGVVMIYLMLLDLIGAAYGAVGMKNQLYLITIGNDCYDLDGYGFKGKCRNLLVVWAANAI